MSATLSWMLGWIEWQVVCAFSEFKLKDLAQVKIVRKETLQTSMALLCDESH